MKSSHFVFSFFLIVSLQFVSQHAKSQNIEATIDSIMQNSILGKAPGGAITILKEAEVIFSKGYGIADLSHDIPFTSKTISDIGSVAKQMTCFAILLLQDEGKLSIDDPIREYFPTIPAFEEVIRIEHLMTHTSGLREVYGMGALAGGRSGDGILQEDAIRLVEFSKELNFKPGTQYNYCNTAYMLLADIVSLVSETSFEEFMRSHIFKPLDMNDTYIMDHQGEWFPNTAHSYQQNNLDEFVNVFDNSTVQGAGGIYTSMDDLVKWAKHLLNPTIGSPQIIANMKKPYHLSNGESTGYGFGLTVGDSYGFSGFGHSGSSAGYRAYLNHFDTLGITILIKTNRTDLPIPRITKMILQEYGNQDIAEDTFSNNVPEEKVDISIEELESYLGRYYSQEADVVYEMIVEDGNLVARSLRNGDIKLSKRISGHFTGDQWFFSTIRFEEKESEIVGFRLDNGRVQGLWFEKL